MPRQAAKLEAVSATYELLRVAAARRQPVSAVYDGLPRLLCPHVLGRKSGRLHAFVYQFGGSSNSGLPMTAEGGGVSRCRAVETLSQSELRPTHGAPSHARCDKLASMKSTSTPKLSPETTRKKDSEAVASVICAPEPCAASRSGAECVARGGPGDPRGRKAGADPGATNPR